MIKLKNILYEGGKLFAPHSDRVTTSEMYAITKKMELTLNDLFRRFEAVKSLKSKETHGDVDLLVLPKSGNWKDKVEERLKSQIVDKETNGNVHSYLLQFDDINKKVHVDFIVAGDENKFQSMVEYYTLNDFSGVIGIFARHLNFKYGDEGFQKRYKDKRGQWHDVYLTHDLMQGLEILGYKNPKARIEKIEDLDDVIEFVLSSPLMDVEYFTPTNMNVSQRKNVGARDNIKYIVDQIRKIAPKATIFDEDYFLKKLFPSLYEKMKKEIDRIEKETYITSKYNGDFIINKLGLKSGRHIGELLKYLSDVYGKELNDIPEDDVLKSLKKYINKNDNI